MVIKFFEFIKEGELEQARRIMNEHPAVLGSKNEMGISPSWERRHPAGMSAQARKERTIHSAADERSSAWERRHPAGNERVSANRGCGIIQPQIYADTRG
jgi:hypothetical protein